MFTCKATGQLRHRFWGNYSALIGLGFDSEAHAKAALTSGKLGEGWKPGKDPRAIVWVGDAKALEGVKDKLEASGADRRKIDSVAKSIDYGERFNVEIEASSPDQLALI